MSDDTLHHLRILWLLGAAALLGGCFLDDDDDSPPVVTEDTPSITVVSDPVVTMNASGFAPLTAKIDLETDVPTRAIVEIDDGTSMRRRLNRFGRGDSCCRISSQCELPGTAPPVDA